MGFLRSFRMRIRDKSIMYNILTYRVVFPPKKCQPVSISKRTMSDSVVSDSVSKVGIELLGRGKVLSQEANKLQMSFLANSIYSRDPISKMSINCRSPFWPIQFLQGQHFFVWAQTIQQAAWMPIYKFTLIFNGCVHCLLSSQVDVVQFP